MRRITRKIGNEVERMTVALLSITPQQGFYILTDVSPAAWRGPHPGWRRDAAPRWGWDSGVIKCLGDKVFLSCGQFFIFFTAIWAIFHRFLMNWLDMS